MKTFMYTSYLLTRKVGPVSDVSFGFTIKRYVSIAGAKAGMRSLKHDLLMREVPGMWAGRPSGQFASVPLRLRKQIADQLCIVKHVETNSLVK